jgi:hypothetical protein
LKSIVRVNLAREFLDDRAARKGLSQESPMPGSARPLRDDERSPLVRFGLGLVAFLLILGAPVSGYFFTKIFLEARATANWPSVKGMLTKARVAEIGFGRYHADVAYSYRVGPNDYTGSRVRLSDGEYDVRDGAAQAIDGLTAGRPVSVFYNPSNPQQSVLRSGVGFQEYALLFVPVPMFGIGATYFWLLWRPRRRRSGGSVVDDDARFSELLLK